MTQPDPNSPNPYAAPPIQAEARGPSPGQILVLALLGVLTLPAAGVAFCGSCFVTLWMADGPQGPNGYQIIASLIMSVIVGIVTLILCVYSIVKLGRKWRLPR